MENSKVNKYSLRGEYYIAMDRIEDILGKQLIKKRDCKEIKEDLLEMFYRNQTNNIPINMVIGDDLEEFISDIIKSYFSSFSWRKWIFNSIKSSFIAMIIIILFNKFILGFFDISILGIVLFFTIIGIIEPLVNYFIVVKVKSEFGRNVAYFISMISVFVLIFLYYYFIN